MKTPLHEIIFALFIALLPHIGNVPHWVVLWCISLWAYVSINEYYQFRPLPYLVRTIITIFGFAGILATFGGYTVDMCVALLVVMTGAKPLETKDLRGRISLICIGFFLVITGLFYSQSLLMTVYLLTCVWLLITVLLRQQDSELSYRLSGKFCFRLMIQAAPLTLLIFFAFPRVSGSLWGFSIQPRTSVGFSNRVSPGDVSTLAQDNSVAFRVKFKEKHPEASDMYWRGIVFDYFDGRQWKKSAPAGPRNFYLPEENLLEYVITMEPHQQRWLFALDYAVGSGSDKFRFADDMTIVSWRRVTEALSYTVKSNASPKHLKTSRMPKFFLKLPKGKNPETREYIRQLLSENLSKHEVIDRVLNKFSEENYFYTLNPDLLGEHSVDEFLFDTKRGYCEHYASAFAFMMRLAGIPTRLVGGYVGGEYNPHGDYYIVKQSDAHVWTEVWFDETGWQRIDPTSAVAPTRVEQGLQSAIDARELGLWRNTGIGRVLYKTWKKAVLRWDVVNYSWDRWMMSYDKGKQRDLLKRFGIDLKSIKGTLTLLGIIILAGILTLLSVLVFRQIKNDNADQVARLYEKFLWKLKQKGIEKPKHMGPVELSELVIERFGEKREETQELISLYVNLRYASEKLDQESVQKLKDMIRAF